jgi:hypothetical protein
VVLTTISWSFRLIHRNNFLEHPGFIQFNRLAQYRALRKLSVGINYDLMTLPNQLCDNCRSLIDLFAQPLSSTLHYVSITLELGRFRDTDWDTFPQFFGKEIDFGWSELDLALARQPSLTYLSIVLAWKSEARVGYLSLPNALPSRAKAEIHRARKENLQVFYARWRELFGRVAERGMLDLRIRCN